MREIKPSHHAAKNILVHWTYRCLSGYVRVFRTEWSLLEGNDSCDCNKLEWHGVDIPVGLHPELYHIKGSNYPDGSGPIDETHARCGDNIAYRIVSLD